MRKAARVVRYGGAMFDQTEIDAVMRQMQDPLGLIPGQKVHEFESVADVVKRGKVVYHAGAVEACAAALKARVSACSAEAGSGAEPQAIRIACSATMASPKVTSRLRIGSAV